MLAEPCDEATDLKARKCFRGHRRTTEGREQVIFQRQLVVQPGSWPQGAGRRVEFERFLGQGGKGRGLGRYGVPRTGDPVARRALVPSLQKMGERQGPWILDP